MMYLSDTYIAKRGKKNGLTAYCCYLSCVYKPRTAGFPAWFRMADHADCISGPVVLRWICFYGDFVHDNHFRADESETDPECPYEMDRGRIDRINDHRAVWIFFFRTVLDAVPVCRSLWPGSRFDRRELFIFRDEFPALLLRTGRSHQPQYYGAGAEICALE